MTGSHVRASSAASTQAKRPGPCVRHRHAGRALKGGSRLRARGRPRARPRRPRAARRRLGGREPVLELVAGPRERAGERRSGWRCIQPKISVAAATTPSDAASARGRAAVAGRAGGEDVPGDAGERAAGRRGASRSARAPSRAARRARSSRSRCARRRGRRRASRCARESTAGATASRPRDELLRGVAEPASGGRAWIATAVPAIAARRARPSNGSFASGSARFSRGRNGDRLERAAPGRGAAARSRASRCSRLRSAATFSSPSSVRTAQAHDVGPCTSTPFASAIPPRRILSAIACQGSRRRPPRAAPAAAERRRRGASSRPSTATTGMISRTAELVNASSARRRCGERERALLDAVAGRACESPRPRRA